MEYEVAEEIDERGAFCPGPLMGLIKAIRQLEVGDIVLLLSSDEGTRTDVPAWVEKAKHKLLDLVHEEGYDKYFVEKLH
ncbi:MAG: sulfurtransferase TusA family protein [Candidatus Heimdallarchaeota archaeon]|jgi:TusA-related sulfurtransferase|nr:sulfurtransferase TusA family protein [Candidatus Heimdallarchaeota archaeon]MCK4769600.1 sulfurtransferase TusA family protein [Candidatus Heimdallarchaeota archaeon]